MGEAGRQELSYPALAKRDMAVGHAQLVVDLGEL
jgi:hypothetical protein